MTRTHARLAACPLTLLLLAGVGCRSEQVTGPMLPVTAGSAAPGPGSMAMNNPSTSKPDTMTPPAGSMKPSSMTPPASGDKPGTMPSMDPAKPPASGSMDPKPQEPEPTTEPMAGEYPDLRGKCGIKSPFPNDDACLEAPSAEEGFQLHVGPKNYDDPAETDLYVMQPGDENSLCWTFQTPNMEDIWYQSSVLSGRAGTHHIINQMYEPGAVANGGFTRCGASTMPIGSIPGASKAYMPRTHVAPEFEDVGRKMNAQATIQSDMHYFNFTDKPILREYWLNIYYAPKDSVKREASGIRGFGGLSWNRTPIAPGTDMVYKYQCPIVGNGHILNILGHYHAHGKRFTASIQRKATGQVEKVFEMYDYQDPAIFEYNSVIKNPPFTTTVAGAVSGILPVSDGDQLMWECHIINDSEVGLTYTNEVMTGEMCNIWGASVDIQPISCNMP